MKNPLIWAHRGASGYAPENTIPAFLLAADMGADGVELDVQFTRDGAVVVCHDETVDRTSNGAGYVKDLDLAELKALNFDNGNKAYEGVQIPTLDEVLDALSPTGLTVNIELKTGVFFYAGIEEAVLAIVKEHHFTDRVIYSSFNHYSVRKVRALCPTAKTGFLYADGPIDMPSYGARYGADALHPACYNLKYPGFMGECRKRGLDVNVWTVNAENELLACRDCGVHAVITNYPKKAAELFRQVP